MEVAALWISIVSASGTGAAAIMAWWARKDALKAEDEAREAEKAALKTAIDSAQALAEANRIAREQFESSRAEASRRDRAKWAARLLRWAIVRAIQVKERTSRRPFRSDPTFAELSELRIALGEATADDLQVAVATDVKTFSAELSDEDSENATLNFRLVAWSIVLEEWIAEPTPRTAAEILERRAVVEAEVRETEDQR